MTDALAKALDELIQQKTFSLEAVEAIKALRDENVVRKEAYDKLHAQHQAIKNDFEKLTKSSAELAKDLAEWIKRAAELKSREDKMTALEGEAKLHAAVAGAYKDAMSIVFRNPVLQQATFGNVPVMNEQGGYLMTGAVNHTTTTTTE